MLNSSTFPDISVMQKQNKISREMVCSTVAKKEKSEMRCNPADQSQFLRLAVTLFGRCASYYGVDYRIGYMAKHKIKCRFIAEA